MTQNEKMFIGLNNMYRYMLEWCKKHDCFDDIFRTRKFVSESVHDAIIDFYIKDK